MTGTATIALQDKHKDVAFLAVTVACSYQFKCRSVACLLCPVKTSISCIAPVTPCFFMRSATSIMTFHLAIRRGRPAMKVNKSHAAPHACPKVLDLEGVDNGAGQVGRLAGRQPCRAPHPRRSLRVPPHGRWLPHDSQATPPLRQQLVITGAKVSIGSLQMSKLRLRLRALCSHHGAGAGWRCGARSRACQAYPAVLGHVHVVLLRHVLHLRGAARLSARAPAHTGPRTTGTPVR